MTRLDEAEADDLLAAYALDALPEAEARRVEEHLRTCAGHRAAAVELRQTGALLSLTAEEREPSPELRRRIVEAVKASPGQSASAEREAPPAPVLALPRRFPSWLPRPARLAVAAAVAIGLGISALIGYQVGQVTGRPVAYTFQGDPSAAPGAEARLVYFKEMWLIKNGVPVDKGISASATGELGAKLSGDLSQFQQFAITIEPGEQQLPTTKPILIGNLQAGST